MKKIKTRYWTFILYPESAPSDWLERLRATGVKISVSPLHNRDLTEKGELKKAHYHVLVCFNNPRPYESMKILTDELNQPIPKQVNGNEGVYYLYEYFSHKNDLKKAQYDEKDIINLNGFNIIDYRILNDSELQALKIKIIDFIVERNIIEYSDLVIELKDLDLEMFEYATNHTLLFDRLISSRRHKQEEIEKRKEKRQDL